MSADIFVVGGLPLDDGLESAKRLLTIADELAASCSASLKEIKKLRDENAYLRTAAEKMSEQMLAARTTGRELADELQTARMYIRQYAPQFKWVCDYCYAMDNNAVMPATWDLVWGCAVCVTCLSKVKEGGGVNVVKGGQFARDKLDPRVRNRFINKESA